MGYVGRHIVKRLRGQIFERMMQLPIGYYDRNSSSVLLSRLTYNTEQVGQAATDSVVVTVREALTIIGSIVLLFYLNARLALIALTMGPLVAWLVTIINRKFRRYSRRIQDSMGDITRVAKETLDAPRVIKVYNAQDYQNAQFETVNEHNRRSHMRLVLTKGLSNPVVQMVTAIGSAVVLSIAISDVDASSACTHGRPARVPRGAGQHRAAVAQPGRRGRVRCSRASPPGRASSSCSTSRSSRRAATLVAAARARRHRVRATCRSPIRSARASALQDVSLQVAAGRDARDRRHDPAAASRRW